MVEPISLLIRTSPWSVRSGLRSDGGVPVGLIVAVPAVALPCIVAACCGGGGDGFGGVVVCAKAGAEPSAAAKPTASVMRDFIDASYFLAASERLACGRGCRAGATRPVCSIAATAPGAAQAGRAPAAGSAPAA